MVAVSVCASAPAASADTVSFSGSRAYGANASLNHALLPDLRLGNVATQQLPCVPRSGTTYKNQVAEVELNSTEPLANPVLRSGTVVNSGTASFSLVDPSTPISVLERSQIETLQILHNALTGVNVIAADAVDVQAQATRASGGAVTIGGSTTLVGLELFGTAQGLQPPPNTELPLPLGVLGLRIVLNEQEPIKNGQGDVIGIKVTGIHVKMSGFLGYTGDIRIGVAQAKIQAAVARMDASAYALRAQGGTLVTVGRQNLLILPCSGSGGAERSQPGVGVSLPGIADVQVPQSIVNGKLVKNPLFTTYAYAISRTAMVDLFGGQIRADAVTSVSRTARKPDGSGSTFVSSIDSIPASPSTPSSGAGTSLVNLVIAGYPIGASVPPNTKFELPGIGKVTLNRQRCSRNGSAFTETRAADSPSTPYDDSKCEASDETRLEVIAIVVEVTVPGNPLGLAPGVIVEVAAAISGVSD